MGCCSLNNVTSLKIKQNATTVRVQLKNVNAFMHVLSTNMHFHHTASGESHYNCVKGFILPIAELELSVQFELELWHLSNLVF